MFTPSIALEIREKINSVLYEGRVQPRHTEYQHFYEDTVDGEVYASVTTKTSLLSREYYKQMAADKAVDHVQTALIRFNTMEPEEITAVFTYAREAHKHDLNRAGEWGTHAHDIVDRYVSSWLRTGVQPQDIKEFWLPTDSNEGKCASLGGEMFMKSRTMFPIASEKYVISKKHKYAGTLDSLWLVGEVYKEREGEPRCNHWWYEKSGGKIKCDSCHREEELSLLLGDWKSSNQIFGHGSMGKYEYAMQVAAYDIAITELTGLKCKKHWIIRLDKQKPMYEVGYITDIKQARKAFICMNTVSDFARSRVAPLENLNGKTIITL
jgi:hypothetical protein